MAKASEQSHMMLQPCIPHTAQHSQAWTGRSRLWSSLLVSSVSKPLCSILTRANLGKKILDFLSWLVVITQLDVIASDARLGNVEHEFYGIHVGAVGGQKPYKDATRLAQLCQEVIAREVNLGVVEEEYAVGERIRVHDRQEVVQHEVEQGLEIPRVPVNLAGSDAIGTERREHIVTSTVQIPAQGVHPLAAATSQWIYFSRSQQIRAGEQQRLCVGGWASGDTWRRAPFSCTYPPSSLSSRR